MVEELPLKAEVGEYTGVGSALAWLALGSCAQAHTPRWSSSYAMAADLQERRQEGQVNGVITMREGAGEW
jgi:hypothetical protein